MRKPLLYSVILTGLSVTSCSMILNNLPGVYTIDVQQGNIVDQAMVDQLRPGMSKRQVLYIMGSPILKDVFHENRWEYLYSNQPGGEDRQQKKIVLYFEDDKIVGLQGDFRPSKLPVIKPSTDVTVDVPKRNLDDSLWGMITAWFSSDSNGVGEVTKPENIQNRTIDSELDDAVPTEVEEEGLLDTIEGWFGSNGSGEADSPGSGPEDTSEDKSPADSPEATSPAQ